MLGLTPASAVFTTLTVVSMACSVWAAGAMVHRRPGISEFLRVLQWAVWVVAALAVVGLIATLVVLPGRARKFGDLPAHKDLRTGSVIIAAAVVMADVAAIGTHNVWPASAAIFVCAGMNLVWRPHTRAVLALDGQRRPAPTGY